MDDFGRDDRMSRTLSGAPTAISSTLQANAMFEPVEVGKNTSSRLSIRAFVPGGPAIGSGLVASRQELPVEQEERQAAEMIAMQMRQHDAVDPVGIDARAPSMPSKADAPKSTGSVAFAVSSRSRC